MNVQKITKSHRMNKMQIHIEMTLYHMDNEWMIHTASQIVWNKRTPNPQIMKLDNNNYLTRITNNAWQYHTELLMHMQQAILNRGFEPQPWNNETQYCFYSNSKAEAYLVVTYGLGNVIVVFFMLIGEIFIFLFASLTFGLGFVTRSEISIRAVMSIRFLNSDAVASTNQI